MAFEIREWYYSLAKGKVQSYVARESEPFGKVFKTLSTFLKKRYIFPADMERILAEVENDSVETPFFRQQPYYLARRKRLDQLKRMLYSQTRGK